MSAKVITGDSSLVQPVDWSFVQLPNRTGSTELYPIVSIDPQPEPQQQKPAKTECDHEPLIQKLNDRIRELELKVAATEKDGLNKAEQARKEGFNSGASAAETKMKGLFEEGMSQISDTLAGLAEARQALRAKAERDVVHLALAVARKVIHREVQVDPEIVLGIIRVALQRLSRNEIQRVRLHPDDVPLVRKQIQNLGGSAEIIFEADPSLTRGSAIFQADRGVLDASTDTQLREIELGFGDYLEK